MARTDERCAQAGSEHNARPPRDPRLRSSPEIRRGFRGLAPERQWGRPGGAPCRGFGSAGVLQRGDIRALIGKLACVAFRHFRQVPAAEEVAELARATAVGCCASVSSTMSHAVCVPRMLGALATLRCLAPWEAPGVGPALATLRGRRTLATFHLAAFWPHGWPFLRVGKKMASGGGRGGGCSWVNLCRLFGRAI